MKDKSSYRENTAERGNTKSKSGIYSTAPYNFIPLNKKVIKSEPLPSFNTYHSDRYTGYIDLEIEAVTPLYIRDTLNDREIEQKLKRDEELKQGMKKEPFANPDFFSPGNQIRIPGSSLRGMIRTLVEIVSFGKFVNFDDRRLYYRSFADRCKNFRDNYRKHVKSKAGILIKEGLNYFIIPTNFKKIFKEEAKELVNQSGRKYTDFSIYEVALNGTAYYLVVSGPMGDEKSKTMKKRDYLIERPNEYVEKIKLNREDIEDYNNDKERKAKINLLDEVHKKGEVPCFYSIYQDNQNRRRVAFGHTLMFRIPYVKSIGDHVPEISRKGDYFDLVEAIFGKETSHASRVFFEDSFLIETENPYLTEAYPKILSSPKPTCFQHYIKQTKENLRDFPKHLAHYNDTNYIRGYKLYWHRDHDWIEGDNRKIEKHPTQYTKIKPIKEGAKFKGRIRFENLSKVELGALMFVLSLPEECCHKLGMAKPLGLGSIKIKPTLYISDRKKRYSELFYEWEDNPKESSDKEFIDAFQSYILTELKESFTDLWQHERLRKLKLMLNFKRKPKNEKTSYLDISEFRLRKVLPEPEEVIKE